MEAKQFIWWLTGYIEAAENHNKDPLPSDWANIKKILMDVTCWEIEQGINK